MSEREGQDDLIQMRLRRFVAVVFALVLLIVGGVIGTMAVLAYIFFWAIG